jgi:hypothetical protein
MSIESPGCSPDQGIAGEALREIRQCSEELRAFTTGLFDQLGRLADELLTHELTRQQVRQQSEREALQGQIDRLALVTTEMAQVLTRQNELLVLQHHALTDDDCPAPVVHEIEPSNKETQKQQGHKPPTVF